MSQTCIDKCTAFQPRNGIDEYILIVNIIMKAFHVHALLLSMGALSHSPFRSCLNTVELQWLEHLRDYENLIIAPGQDA